MSPSPETTQPSGSYRRLLAESVIDIQRGMEPRQTDAEPRAAVRGVSRRYPSICGASDSESGTEGRGHYGGAVCPVCRSAIVLAAGVVVRDALMVHAECAREEGGTIMKPVEDRKPGVRAGGRDEGVSVSPTARAKSRTLLDAPPLCVICFWPVELYHPAATYDGDLVHALCLDAKTPAPRIDRESRRKAVGE